MVGSSSSSGVDGGVKFKMEQSITYEKLSAEISILRNEYWRLVDSDPINEELLSGFKARVMKVFQGNHPNLLLGLNNSLFEKHKITLPLQHFQTKGKKTKKGKKMKVEEYGAELPWDVLDIIYKALDFDDLFEFAGVCKSWRAFHKIYWTTFLASQEPLLLQDSNYSGNRLFSFISIPGQKVYYLKMMKHFSNDRYLACCGGYFIMEDYPNDNLLVVINPFTRIKKLIDIPTFEDRTHGPHVLLAFDKCSEEFVLVVLYDSSTSLHVYQSQNSTWVTYSTKGILGNIVDFVVFQNIIYVVTNKADIGVLSLNSANIKFLKLKRTCLVTSSSFKLVNCDDQLLVVNFTSRKIKVVYKIDFSTMSYVKLDTLGDIALFYSMDTHCYGLSNPNRWGYDSNSVYVVTHSHVGYSVYSGDEKLEKYMPLPNSHGTAAFMFDWCCTYSGDEDKLREYILFPTASELGFFQYDWCFRHLRYEVDYSLVE